MQSYKERHESVSRELDRHFKVILTLKESAISDVFDYEE